ncbi:UNVERIFIED_CONTAM: LINE-1 retrotransposable element O protein [Sesamum latifolium]|uniref:LINE-1 retrotransposable element O protein n=1 Tax=Sesamum latifolium TaxID=2727402 RepID=A0AAW2WED6_9LAMI
MGKYEVGGRHPINAAQRATLASVVYHILEERNNRRFGGHQSTPAHVARLCIDHPYENASSLSCSKRATTLGTSLDYGLTKTEAGQQPLPLKIPSTGHKILQTDASNEFCGSILIEEENEKKHFCGHASGQFKDSEKHYHAVYKEILGIKGYNQQHLPPRCALKVDIRKAYDTVEWDFLSAALKLFGFPPLFISWIEECVTTPSFLVCLNGPLHGFFRGSRGLRQGDPMSPYLFVLVMEVLNLILQQIIDQDGGFSYHWRCEALHLFQLGFADDLLLFSRADATLVHVFKRGLTIFADLSELHVNPQKSDLILSRAASEIRDAFSRCWTFEKGSFPCVMIALQVYYAMAFILPKTIIRAIEKRLRAFLWKGSNGGSYAKVSWHQVCWPIKEGGLGIRDLLVLYRGLMGKKLWRIISADRTSLWVDWIFHYRLYYHSVWTVSDRTGSWGWQKLLRLRVLLQPFIEYKIGSGSSISLWHDPWHELGPLILRFPMGPRHTATLPTDLLNAVIMEGVWSWPLITNIESVEIIHSLRIIYGGRIGLYGLLQGERSLRHLRMLSFAHLVPK